VVASDDYGRDLTGVQNLKKKHKRLEAELASHEPAIQAVQEAGEKLMDVSNLGVPEIEQVSVFFLPPLPFVLLDQILYKCKSVLCLIVAAFETIERSLVRVEGNGGDSRPKIRRIIDFPTILGQG
jgi:hypothetical protein